MGCDMYKKVTRLANDESGATLAEYGLLVGLIAVVCVAVVQGLGLTINTVFSTINADFIGI
jgi:pilus assembly protein Flp/PilA